MAIGTGVDGGSSACDAVAPANKAGERVTTAVATANLRSLERADMGGPSRELGRVPVGTLAHQTPSNDLRQPPDDKISPVSAARTACAASAARVSDSAPAAGSWR